MEHTHSRATALLIATSFCAPAAAFGQTLTVQVHDGLVTLDAVDAPLREIVDRWAAVRHVMIVNRDSVPTSRVSLHLEQVPELEALATLLRTTAGYILARDPERDASNAPDRLLIVPGRRGTSDGPVPTPPAANARTFTVPEPAPVTPAADATTAAPDDAAASVGGVPSGGVGGVADAPTGGIVSDAPPRPRSRAVERPVEQFHPPQPTLLPDGRLDPASVTAYVKAYQQRAGEPAPEPPAADPSSAPPRPDRPSSPFGVTTGSAQPGMAQPAAASQSDGQSKNGNPER